MRRSHRQLLWLACAGPLIAAVYVAAVAAALIGEEVDRCRRLRDLAANCPDFYDQENTE